MKVLQFSPRRWTSLPQAPRRMDEEHDLEQLRAEHPLLSRSVEVMELGSWIASSQSQGSWAAPAAGLAAVTSLTAAAWGVNKLARGETTLDRVEGLGHLALSAAYGAEALNIAGVANPASAVASGCEILLGGADLVRGLREHDQLRAWTGAAGVLSGAALATSVLVPGATGFAQAVAVMSLAARQSILGAR